MQQALDVLRNNWDLIAPALWQFLAFGILMFGVGWAIARQSYSDRLESMSSRLNLASEKSDFYKEQLSGNAPDAATIEHLTRLQESVAKLTPYGITKEAERRMLDALRATAGTVTIARAVDAADADNLYRQVINVFKTADWTVGGGVIFGLSDEPDCGVTLLVWTETNPSEVDAVRAALRVSGVDFVERLNAAATNSLENPQIVFSARDPNYQQAARWA